MKKNFIYNIIYQMLVLILPLITVPYVSRTLGAEGVGIYSYTYSIVYYFVMLSMLGLQNYGNRTIAKVRDNKEELSKEFLSIYSFQIITSLVMTILYLIYVIFFAYQYRLISFIQIIYILSAMFDINWFFFGMEKFKLTITRNTIIKLISLILIFVFIKTTNDLWKYTAILAGSTLLSNLMLFGFLCKYIKPVKINRKDVFKHFKPNLILFLPVIAVSIYKVMDKIMLGIICNVTEVGYYENAEKIIQVPVAIISALGTVMLPRVSNMISNNEDDKVKKILEKTMPFVMFMTLPMMLGLIAIGEDFATIFLGVDFEKSGILIQYLSITILFLAWGNVVRTQYLIPKEKDKEYVISVFIGAIINFVLNLIFVPRYGAIGACIGTIFAELSVPLYQSYVLRKELDFDKYIKGSWGFFIKAIIMFVIVLIVGNFIDNNKIRVLLQIIIGGITYAILNFKYIYLNLNDILKNESKSMII